jgi:glycosyltransferase involved in cell wall biosynthesis
MRIAIFTTSFYPTIGGAEKQADMLARGLQEKGHDVVVFAPEPKIKNFREQGGIQVVRYPRLRSKNWFLRGCLAPLLKAHRETPFALIHAHGAYPAAWVVADWCKREFIPLAVRAYGGDILPDEEIQSSWLRRWRTRRSLASAKFLIAQNAELEEILAGFAGKNTTVIRIRNGVDIANFAKSQPASADFRASLGSYALTLSNFYEKKGLEILLKAWATVTARAPRHRLVICGHGPLENSLRQLRKNLGLEDTVDFMGNVRGAEKVALLQACTCYVSSARREPFSNALLEALAAGAWLVATRTGGNIEVIEETKRGELVAPEDPAELANALLRCLENPPPALCEEQRRAVAAPFDWRHSIEKYQNEIIARL